MSIHGRNDNANDHVLPANHPSGATSIVRKEPDEWTGEALGRGSNRKFIKE